MTAEIAIMNTGAVALAADSAVTVQTPDGQKIYNTVNKLFTLSKYEPIGLMIYDGADLLGVPWEVIVKAYRAELGSTSFATVRDYLDHLIEWVANNESLFPVDLRTAFVEHLLNVTLLVLASQVDETVKAILDDEGEISEERVSTVVNETIDKALSYYGEFPDSLTISLDDALQVLDQHGDVLEGLMDEHLQELPLSDETQERLRTLCGNALAKNAGDPLSPHSGLVIAGFGSGDYFPALYEVAISGIVDNCLRATLIKEQSIHPHTNDAAIIPFAQREMVDTFMSGIDPRYRSTIDGFMSRLFDDYPEQLLATLPQLSEQERQELVEPLRQIGHTAREHLNKNLEEYSRTQFIAPVIGAVGVLPKDELAEMAESLVNLTSFKRRMSIGEVESVGGAIDVCVISKGDGFIWIKRKHYFEPELNPHFQAKYFGTPGQEA